MEGGARLCAESNRERGREQKRTTRYDKRETLPSNLSQPFPFLLTSANPPTHRSVARQANTGFTGEQHRPCSSVFRVTKRPGWNGRRKKRKINAAGIYDYCDSFFKLPFFSSTRYFARFFLPPFRWYRVLHFLHHRAPPVAEGLICFIYRSHGAVRPEVDRPAMARTRCGRLPWGQHWYNNANSNTHTRARTTC